jgi:hypothetical protein
MNRASGAKKALLTKFVIQYRAQKLMTEALRDGRLTRQPCLVCGNPRSEGHHPDYRFPLKVYWLCRRHHSQVHAAERRKAKPRAEEQLITYNRETLTFREWAGRIGLSPAALAMRIYWKWPPGLAVTLKPCRKRTAFYGNLVRAARECLAYLRPKAARQSMAETTGPGVQLALGL